MAVDRTLELQLQALPLPAELLTGKPVLREDDIAVVALRTWPIRVEMFNGFLSGPVPIIFANDIEATRTVLEQNQDEFFEELNGLMNRSQFLFLFKFNSHINHIYEP